MIAGFYIQIYNSTHFLSDGISNYWIKFALVWTSTIEIFFTECYWFRWSKFTFYKAGTGNAACTALMAEVKQCWTLAVLWWEMNEEQSAISDWSSKKVDP